jgi:hypothetical protein
MRVATQVSGGGAMIQSMARSMGSGEEWRRTRDCLPTEPAGSLP